MFPDLAQVLERTVGELAKRFDMSWRLQYRARRKRVAIFVSKLDHCLFDILIRHQSGGSLLASFQDGNIAACWPSSMCG